MAVAVCVGVFVVVVAAVSRGGSVVVAVVAVAVVSTVVVVAVALVVGVVAEGVVVVVLAVVSTVRGAGFVEVGSARQVQPPNVNAREPKANGSKSFHFIKPRSFFRWTIPSMKTGVKLEREIIALV